MPPTMRTKNFAYNSGKSRELCGRYHSLRVSVEQCLSAFQGSISELVTGDPSMPSIDTREPQLRYVERTREPPRSDFPEPESRKNLSQPPQLTKHHGRQDRHTATLDT